MRVPLYPFTSPLRRTARFLGLAAGALVLAPALVLAQETASSAAAQEKEKEKPVKITEEILVIGKAPREAPLATVTSIEPATVEALKPRDLADVLRFAPGVQITVGSKEEYTLKIRGIDSRRIALLVDGVPVSEPYYGSFDLKTVYAGGIQTLQVTKGPSSVLYGPNTRGGIVNLITRRPSAEPLLSFSASTGERATRSLGVDGAYQWNKVGFTLNGLFQDSDGFRYSNPAGKRVDRTNTDYERWNVGAKLFYNPSDRTELMASAGYYHSVYGMPPDLYGKPRYWRFKDWNRTSFSAGGFTSVGESSTIRFRTYYVGYDNTMDQYSDAAQTKRQFESTFDNANYGFFGLADLGLADWNSVKFSLYYQKDVARTQDDVGAAWDEFDQETFSAGVEDHLSLSDRWKVIGGLSFDRLSKFTGNSTSKVNPLLGLKFTPWDSFDLHLSASGKSKFPNMRAMYSPSSGNPDLKSEFGRSYELGFTFNRGVYLSGAAFANEIRDLIDSIRLPSGLRQYFNIGKARINGFELQAQKSWKGVGGTVNYTYLEAKNVSDNRPLDLTPKHNLNFDATVTPMKGLSVSLFGLWASDSFWYDTNARKSVDIPAYFSLDGIVAWDLGRFSPFLRVTNLIDDYFYTEPGYPWRGRFFEVGLKVDVF